MDQPVSSVNRINQKLRRHSGVRAGRKLNGFEVFIDSCSP